LSSVSGTGRAYAASRCKSAVDIEETHGVLNGTVVERGVLIVNGSRHDCVVERNKLFKRSIDY